MMFQDTRFRFGAVYFRKSNPPVQDWERDHRVAAEDGHTLFRHWVPWNAVEVAPDRFDWDDYDRQMDLAAENGIKVVLAEMLLDYPEWPIRQVPHARAQGRNGEKRSSEMHINCATGGHYALCLDNPEVSEAAARFLIELAIPCATPRSWKGCASPARRRRFRSPAWACSLPFRSGPRSSI